MSPKDRNLEDDLIEATGGKVRVEYRDPRMKGLLNAEQATNLRSAKRYVKANPRPKGRVVINRYGDIAIHGYGKRTDGESVNKARERAEATG